MQIGMGRSREKMIKKLSAALAGGDGKGEWAAVSLIRDPGGFEKGCGPWLRQCWLVARGEASERELMGELGALMKGMGSAPEAMDLSEFVAFSEGSYATLSAARRAGIDWCLSAREEEIGFAPLIEALERLRKAGLALGPAGCGEGDDVETIFSVEMAGACMALKEAREVELACEGRRAFSAGARL